MGNKILMDTEVLARTSTKLEELKAGLEQAARSLNGVTLDRASGGKLSMNRSIQLSGSGKTVEGEDVESLVKACGIGLKVTGARAQTLAQHVKEAVDAFEQGETALVMLDMREGVESVFSDAAKGKTDSSGSAGVEQGVVQLGGDAPVLAGKMPTIENKDEMLQSLLKSDEDGMTDMQRELADAYIERMKHVVSPADLLSTKNYEKLNAVEHVSSGIWALITGQYTHIWGSSYEKERYLFGKALDGLENQHIQMLSTDLLPDEMEEMMSMMQEDAESWGLDDEDVECLELISEVVECVEEVTDVFNKLQIVQSLDQGEVLELARIYQQSDDETMNKVGQQLEKLANASTQERIAMIVGGEISGLVLDGVQGAISGAIDSAAEKTPFVAVTITRDLVDDFTGVGELPQLQNEVGFSTQAAQATYDVLQQDIAAYEANPTRENYDRAMRTYEQYHLEVANAEQAVADWIRHKDESTMGQLLDYESREVAIQQAEDNVSFHRTQAEAIRTSREGFDKYGV